MTRRGRGSRRPVVALVLAVLLVATTVASDRLLHQPLGGEVLTLLLLGSDQGPPRGGDPAYGRADAFHLLFVARDRSHATFVNVPRDAWMDVPGRGPSRINACLRAGPDRCVATVERRWGINVDDWFVTSMLGMGRAFEEFGGVEIDVERPLQAGGPDLTAGVQRLGLGALTYARDRKGRPGGDYTRTAAQAELLAAAHRELLGAGPSVRDVMDAVGILRRHTVTSASPRALLRYAFAATEVAPRRVAGVTLRGSAGPSRGVVSLGAEAARLVADAADDGRVDDAE